MANAVAQALSGRSSSSWRQMPNNVFVRGGEFESTLLERFPAPRPITTEMIEEAIHFEESLEHVDDEIDYSKYEPTQLSAATVLRLSFRRIPELCNLEGLDLEELRLDNNTIRKIENLAHLTRLKWLGELYPFPGIWCKVLENALGKPITF